ncbi:hypothetical protein FRAAL0243 [Frankia alni ACN14a]|uniref:Uncharacterized protein n=2 Tax=Frankiaceae TaxID=74712 RepID=Q0RU24_FRAAA|nr:hypothetical protein [Frankia sp. AvcI1]CAJ58920.1 hypothetical protein FRAAL0243 [Frankia alni ACN14a]
MSSSQRDKLRSDILVHVVNCLDASTDLYSPAARNLLISRFEQRSGQRVFIPHSDVTRDWWFRFVEACLNDLDNRFEERREYLANGFASLVDAIHDLRPGSVLVDLLLRLRDEWEAAEVADEAGGLWDLLREELADMPARRVVRAFHDACHPAHPPAHCVDAWHLFLWAASREPEPARLPSHARFLLQCAHVLTPGTRVRVEAWLRGEAHRSGLTHELNQTQLAVGRPGHQRTYVVSLSFQPVGPSPEDHLASARLYGADHEVRHLGTPRMARPGGFEEIAAGVVDEAEEILKEETPLSEPVSLAVEVFLPLTRMDLPVTSWRRESDGDPRLLIEDHTVVVRSFERTRQRGPSLRQRRRWAQLLRPSPPAMAAAHAADLKEFELARNDRIVAVVLSGPPTPGSPAGKELADALREGIGVVAWQHADPDRPATDTALLDLLTRVDAHSGVGAFTGVDAHADVDSLSNVFPLTLPRRFREENLIRLERRLPETAGSANSRDTANSQDTANARDMANSRDMARRRVATLLWEDLRQDTGQTAPPSTAPVNRRPVEEPR